MENVGIDVDKPRKLTARDHMHLTGVLIVVLLNVASAMSLAILLLVSVINEQNLIIPMAISTTILVISQYGLTRIREHSSATRA